MIDVWDLLDWTYIIPWSAAATFLAAFIVMCFIAAAHKHGKLYAQDNYQAVAKKNTELRREIRELKGLPRD